MNPLRKTALTLAACLMLGSPTRANEPPPAQEPLRIQMSCGTLVGEGDVHFYAGERYIVSMHIKCRKPQTTG